jgi:hypothetical protein
VVPNHAAQTILRSTTTLEAIRPFQEASVSEITRPFWGRPGTVCGCRKCVGRVWFRTTPTKLHGIS